MSIGGVWVRADFAIAGLLWAQAQVKDYAVHPAPLASVQVTDEFWAPRLGFLGGVSLTGDRFGSA